MGRRIDELKPFLDFFAFSADGDYRRRWMWSLAINFYLFAVWWTVDWVLGDWNDVPSRSIATIVILFLILLHQPLIEAVWFPISFLDDELRQEWEHEQPQNDVGAVESLYVQSPPAPPIEKVTNLQ